MRTVIVNEQRRYSKSDIADIFECSEIKTEPLLRRLKEYGIVKTVPFSAEQKNMSDLISEDEELSSEDNFENKYFIFKFVGIAIVESYLIKAYPKYISSSISVSEFKQILKVLEKVNSREQIVKLYIENSEEEKPNRLGLMLYLINDYNENGVYSNTEQLLDINGNGEVLWDQTVNDSIALISNNRPYYTELKTRRQVIDEFDFFKRLHEYILTSISKEMGEELLDLFDLSEIDISDAILGDFGDIEYILYRLDRELSSQFVTRKQLVLKAMYSLLENEGSLNESSEFNVFGTNKFNVVWEKICGSVLNNIIDKPLLDINLPSPLCVEYDKYKKVKEIIERPIWSIGDIQSETDTLKPDIITISKEENTYSFNILDAKYYVIRNLNANGIEGQPGIDSITKQYLYQLAYSEFIKKHGFEKVRNAFLLPSDSEKFEQVGIISLNFIEDGFGLEPIEVFMLPAKEVYNLFLRGEHLSVEELYSLD